MLVAAAWVWTQWSLDIGSDASYVTNATSAACTAPALPTSTNTQPSGILELKLVYFWYHRYLNSYLQVFIIKKIKISISRFMLVLLVDVTRLAMVWCWWRPGPCSVSGAVARQLQMCSCRRVFTTTHPCSSRTTTIAEQRVTDHLIPAHILGIKCWLQWNIILRVFLFNDTRQIYMHRKI